MTDSSVPEGFVQLPTGLGYTDTLQPSYRKLDGDTVHFGLWWPRSTATPWASVTAVY